MISRISIVQVFILTFFGAGYSAIAQSAKVTDLRCEHLTDPIGIDNPTPRLSWKIADTTAGSRQVAYQIVFGKDSAEVADRMAKSKQTSTSNLVNYSGPDLQAFTRYYWKVLVWNEQGKKLDSQVSFFETGMMDSKNWKGFWITDVYGTNKDLKPAPYFRKSFSTTKKVKSARAYIAVAGLYELSINGKKIGDHILDPMYTRFDRRTMYVSYDVTSAINAGRNAVGVVLGNGWYNHQSTAVWNFHNAPWRDRPTFCMDLRLSYEDGSTEVISTDNSWKTSTGPIVFNSIYTAEHVDMRLSQSGWDLPEFDDAKWTRVYYRSNPSNNVVSQTLVPIRQVETIASKSMTKLNDTTWVFDLGRNISGVSSINLNGKAGTVVRLRHAERLKKDGHVDQSNIDVHYRPVGDADPFQTDVVILSGKGRENFTPKFNYKGFQYVEVTGNAALNLSKEDLVGYFIHSDVEPIGKISSSNPVLDKIWEAANNSYLSNLMGYPTDCPQREKNGWTGDAHIASETGLYSFDASTVYEKWMADHRDEQQSNGVLPSIIPTGGWGYEWGNGPDWTSTVAIIPWNLYLFTGDDKVLRDNYNSIKKYVDHIEDLYPTGICSWGLGDWVPVRSKSPVELTSTAYYYKDVMILLDAARMFKRVDDIAHYEKLAETIRSAYNKKFYKSDSAIYGSGFQTELAISLHFGLVPPNVRGAVAANLAKAVERENFHLDVGLLGTKSILNALSENGYADIAYKVATQETFPSWGWWIKNGATTLYENWDINAANDISLNHIMFGEVGAWFYKGIAGLYPDASQPGFKNILVKPNFVLPAFKASHNGPFGEIISEWKTVNGTIEYTVTVPANSTATFYKPLKNGEVRGWDSTYQLGAGKHTFYFQ